MSLETGFPVYHTPLIIINYVTDGNSHYVAVFVYIELNFEKIKKKVFFSVILIIEVYIQRRNV